MTQIEELRKLKELLDEGIITQEEFDERKKTILRTDINLAEESDRLSNKSFTDESSDNSNSNSHNSDSKAIDLNSFKSTSDNFYCKALYYLGWTIIILGSIGSIIMASESYNAGVTVLIVGLFSTAVSGFLILGVSEIINILNESKKSLMIIANSTKENKEMNL